MIFHENRLQADDSHVISYLFFVEKLGKMSQNLSSAAVVIGAWHHNKTKYSLFCVSGFDLGLSVLYHQHVIPLSTIVEF